MSAQCKYRSVVGGRADTRESLPRVWNGFETPNPTRVGNETTATKTGVGKSTVVLATVVKVFCLPQEQSFSS